MNLLELNHDCLVYMATFLDVYTLAYVLARVCKDLHVIAHDPVVWALNVVEPCCARQLIVLARQHPTIRHVCGSVTLSPAMTDELIRCCPGICHLDDSYFPLPDNNLPLSAAKWSPSQPIPLFRQPLLRALSFSTGEPSQISQLSELCTGVTSLQCEALLATAPDGFPRLVTLCSDDDKVTHASWTTFVETHPALRSLSIDFTGTGNVNVMPQNLYRVLISCDGDSREFALQIVAENCDSVLRVAWYMPVSSAVDQVLSSCTRLKSLMTKLPKSVVKPNPFSDESDRVPHFRFVETLNLSELSLPTVFDLPPDTATAVAQVLSNRGRKLPLWCTSVDAALVVCSNTLSNVTDITLSSSVSLDSCHLLGQGLTRLRKATVLAIDMTEEQCAALAPAFGSVVDVSFSRCPLGILPLVAMVASSRRLEVLSLAGADTPEAEAVVAAFVDGWRGAPLRRLTVQRGSDAVIALLEAAVSAGTLRARTAKITKPSSVLFSLIALPCCNLAAAMCPCGISDGRK